MELPVTSAQIEADFDELTRRFHAANAARHAADAATLEQATSAAIAANSDLLGHAFLLKDWLFIARGEFSDLRPYIAAHPDMAGGQPQLRAFTDSTRLERFAVENGLSRPDGAFLSLPTETIVQWLAQFPALGATGIWFNSNSQSLGFARPISALAPTVVMLDESWSLNAKRAANGLPPVRT